MGIIFLSLGLGIAVGFLKPSAGVQSKIVHRATMLGLFLLLAAMGAQLGANEELLANLGKMGLHALVLAGFAVLGSVAAVYGFFRWLEPTGPGRQTDINIKAGDRQ